MDAWKPKYTRREKLTTAAGAAGIVALLDLIVLLLFV